MAGNDITDILRIMDIIAPLSRDMENAGRLIKNSFEHNYIQRVSDAAKSERNLIKKKPSREIIMLRAFKNYANKDAALRIDSVISALTVIDTIRSIHGKINAHSAKIEGASKNVSSPNAALSEMTEIVAALSLMGLIQTNSEGPQEAEQ